MAEAQILYKDEKKVLVSKILFIKMKKNAGVKDLPPGPHDWAGERGGRQQGRLPR